MWFPTQTTYPTPNVFNQFSCIANAFDTTWMNPITSLYDSYPPAIVSQYIFG